MIGGMDNKSTKVKGFYSSPLLLKVTSFLKKSYQIVKHT